MHNLIDSLQRLARHELAQRSFAALAVVESVFGCDDSASEHSCTVRLRDSDLVLPHVPIATGILGMVSLPQEGDLVVVLFLGGDRHAPVVVGRLYDEKVAPPKHGPGETVLSLPSGESADDKRIELRITALGDGKRNLKLVLDGSAPVEIEVKDQEISLSSGQTKLRLAQPGSSDGVAELSVGGSKITVAQSGDVTVAAEGKLLLKGTEVEISGDATVKVGGQMIKLN
jgi:uncharacterized protein involved in type VI secretion and phage assembly